MAIKYVKDIILVLLNLKKKKNFFSHFFIFVFVFLLFFLLTPLSLSSSLFFHFHYHFPPFLLFLLYFPPSLSFPGYVHISIPTSTKSTRFIYKQSHQSLANTHGFKLIELFPFSPSHTDITDHPIVDHQFFSQITHLFIDNI